jgi:hypothetical protein
LPLWYSPSFASSIIERRGREGGAMSSKKSRADTAYHEAEHAIACMFADGQPIRIRTVSIIPNKVEGTLGHVLQRKIPKWALDDITCGYLSPRTERLAMNRAVVSLAGMAAADRRRGRRSVRGSAVYLRHPEYGRLIVDGDIHTAVTLLDRVAGGDPDEASILYKLADHRARRLVSVHRDLVTKLAEALLERGEMTGDEALEVVLRRASGPFCASPHHQEDAKVSAERAGDLL